MVDARVPGVPAAGVVTDTGSGTANGRFDAFRTPAFRVLWISSLFMFVAMTAQQVARGWLAVELTGTNAGIGGVFLAFGVPMLVLSPVGGVVADRFPKRAVLMVCQSVILAGALIVTVGSAFDVLAYWMLLLSAAVHGAGMAVMGPTRMAYTGEVVPRALLPNAVVLQQMGLNSTRVIGPAVAGALIGVETIGAGGVYFLTSAMFAIALVFTWFLPPVPRRTSAVERSPVADLVDGFRYVRARRPLLLLVVVSIFVIMIGFCYMAFLPTLATDVFDVSASGYGTMSAVSAGGALVASLWIAGQVNHMSVWRLQNLCGLAFGIGILLLGLAPTFVVALVVLVLLGGASSGFQATNSSLVLTETDLEYHGRMQSLMMTGYAASGIVALPLGVVADTIGLRATVVGMGILCTAAMGAYALARRRYVTDEESLPG
jgi:MFS family permease